MLPSDHAPPRPAPAPVYVGRGTELATVRAALEHTAAFVVIEGEPGIGKSRLVPEAVTSRDEQGALIAACPPLPEPSNLDAVVDGVRRM